MPSLRSRREHEGRVPQVGVPAGTRNSKSVKPPSRSGATSGNLTVKHVTETPVVAYNPSAPPTAVQKAIRGEQKAKQARKRRVVAFVASKPKRRSQRLKAPTKYEAPKALTRKTSVAPAKVAGKAPTNPIAKRLRKEFVQAKQQVARTTGIKGPLAPEQKRFVKGVAKHTKLSPRAVAAQALAEESGPAAASYEASGEHNYLNIGPGQHYGSNREAVKETSKLLDTSPNYAGIRSTRGKGPQAQIQAIGASPWGTVGSVMQGTLPEVSVKHNPKAVQKLQRVEGEAKAKNVKLPKGDLSRGPGKTVQVRADAQGMVKWAESALGTQEGSPKQLRWAGKEGLSSTEPWCANFISNGLARRGVALPPNPNYVPSYETEWKGGRDIGTNLAKAKPGDLIAYSGDHIALYKGSGKAISGNYGNEVAESNASEGPAPISAILRPNYKGGVISVKESKALPGSVNVTGSIASSSAPAGTASPTAAPKKPKATVKRESAPQHIAKVEAKLKQLSSPHETPSTEVLTRLEQKYGSG